MKEINSKFPNKRLFYFINLASADLQVIFLSKLVQHVLNGITVYYLHTI